MARLSEMTEEQILDELMRACMEHVGWSRKFELDRCVSVQTKRLGELYREDIGLGRYDGLDRTQMVGLNLLLERYTPLIWARTVLAQKKYLAEKRVAEINYTSAKAIISSALEGTGYGVRIEQQKYRAKVMVSFDGRVLSFYVPYKEMGREGRMREILDSIGRIRENLQVLGGRDITLKRG